MTFPAVFAIIIGILMLAQWIFFLAAGKVPELKTQPVEIRFHIVSELLTALALILAGVGLLSAAAWSRAVFPVAAGALLYSIVKSAGYFVERKVLAMGLMFAAILGLAGLSLIIFFSA